MNNNTTQPTTEVVNTVITGEIKLRLSKLGLQYEKVLQDAENIKFSKETLDQDFAPLKKLRELSTKLAEEENPHTKAWAKWNGDRKSLLDPVKATLATKTAEYTKLATEIKAELAKQQKEAARIQLIKDTISSFTIEWAGKIAAADSITALTAAQMRIGTEKSRKSFYAELYPDLIAACQVLETALKTQKEKVRELEGLGKKAASANDEQLIEIIEKKELITAEIEQAKNQVQEDSVNAITSTTVETLVPESTLVAPKARRTSWQMKIVDPKKAFAAGMVEVELNKVKAKAVLDELKKASPDNDAFFKDGIHYYQEKSY